MLIIYSLTGIFLQGYIKRMNSETLSALAEPTRLRIVELLRDGPKPVGVIATRLKLRQPQASKHLRVLSEAGLVEAEQVANLRVYHLKAQPFRELDRWLESYKHLWSQKLDTLDEYLQEVQGKNQSP